MDCLRSQSLCHNACRSTSSVGCISFKSDSRWIGFTRAKESDIFAGYSASQSIYLAEVAWQER